MGHRGGVVPLFIIHKSAGRRLSDYSAPGAQQSAFKEISSRAGTPGVGFLPIPPRRPGNRGSERCSDSRQGTPLSRRRWEAALLPGPGRRAARGDSHKDHVVSCPVPSSPGTRSIHHRDSRDGGGSERAAQTRGTRRPRPAPARPRRSPRVLRLLEIQEPGSEHRGGSISLQPGAQTAATCKRPRGGSSRSARAGAAGGAQSGAGAEPGAADAKSRADGGGRGGGGGLRANRLSPRGPGPLPARGGPLLASLGGGETRGGGMGAWGGFFLAPGAPSSGRFAARRRPVRRSPGGPGLEGGGPVLQPLAWSTPESI